MLMSFPNSPQWIDEFEGYPGAWENREDGIFPHLEDFANISLRSVEKMSVSPTTWIEKLRKNNSTGTLFVKDSLANPDMEKMMDCVSGAFHVDLQNSCSSSIRFSWPDEVPDFLDCLKYPMTDCEEDFSHIPLSGEIRDFLVEIIHRKQLPTESLILCYVFIQRLKMKHIGLLIRNWRKIVLIALVVATKVLEDQAVWNIDFLDLFPRISTPEINSMERFLLEKLEFNVSLKTSEYAKYFFELCDLSKSQEMLYSLDEQRARALEQKTVMRETMLKTEIMRRTVSSDNLERKEFLFFPY